MKRYKPVGWRNEPHRHYLAAKGIKTKHDYSTHRYNAFKKGDVVNVNIPGIGRGRILSTFGTDKYRVEDIDGAGSGIYSEDELSRPMISFEDPEPADDIVLTIEDEPADDIVLDIDTQEDPRKDEYIEFNVPYPGKEEFRKGLDKSKQTLKSAGKKVGEGAEFVSERARTGAEFVADRAQAGAQELRRRQEVRRRFKKRLDPIKEKRREQESAIREEKQEMREFREKQRRRGKDIVGPSEEFWGTSGFLGGLFKSSQADFRTSDDFIGKPVQRAFRKEISTAKRGAERFGSAASGVARTAKDKISAAREDTPQERRESRIRKEQERLQETRAQERETSKQLKDLQAPEKARREWFEEREFKGELPK